ncbi:hypothetical protein ASD12_31565 [Mesorhizobium sp. Root102]|jgi:hypothetical protein|uniref:hypothetical protein n=1 Tax=unclassified Mesorhizobium TaxID=325217 RepID=UPI0006F5A2FA|nr:MULTISPECIES: hypothetical protein [unclassified Mesorhizobium]KQU85492.1 hypothetical protein ASD12_31565 [Mesorhizobium sp. Root102]KRB24332.1 hypothetical protein ASE05_32490 [Mesorhizobium sp. Root172]
MNDVSASEKQDPLIGGSRVAPLSDRNFETLKPLIVLAAETDVEDVEAAVCSARGANRPRSSSDADLDAAMKASSSSLFQMQVSRLLGNRLATSRSSNRTKLLVFMEHLGVPAAAQPGRVAKCLATEHLCGQSSLKAASTSDMEIAT